MQNLTGLKTISGNDVVAMRAKKRPPLEYYTVRTGGSKWSFFRLISSADSPLKDGQMFTTEQMAVDYLRNNNPYCIYLGLESGVQPDRDYYTREPSLVLPQNKMEGVVAMMETGNGPRSVYLKEGESCINGELASEILNVLQAAEEALEFCTHPYFGLPILLLKRVDRLRGIIEDGRKA